ncbi:MAG TPA: type III pantothenate kinase [Candidatus Limnocylindrales bacterium]|nr:type III pantothenate kinase [Candidatus Limnocylindrales bacterium]
MRLLLDAGNSTVSAALANGTALVRTARLPIARSAADATLQAALDEVFGRDGIAWSALDAIGLASVVPTASVAVAALAARMGARLVVAEPDTVPLPVRVAHPEQVGPDRLVNALAAARLHGTPAIVVDVGTATTWECVDADGAFVGGAIAPGLLMSLAALAERTSLLPRVAATPAGRAIGTDTIEAIRSGTVLGHRELVEGLTRRIRAELADTSSVAAGDVRTILTGGLAATAWGETLQGFDVRDPDLTLRGLALVVEQALGSRGIRRAEPARSGG